MGLGGVEKRSKLAGRDEEEGEQYERAESMTYDPQVLLYPHVLRQHGDDVGLLREDPGEVLQAEYLEVADEVEEHAHQEEDGSPVQPRAQLQHARDRIAQVHVPQERDPRSAGAVPPYLIRAFCTETGHHEDGQQLERSLEGGMEQFVI